MHALTPGDRQVPAFGDGCAGEDVGENTGNVISNGNEDDGPDRDMECFRREDAEVEDEDGDLGETGGRTVEDGSKHVELCRLVRGSSSGLLDSPTFMNHGERSGMAGTSHMCFPKPQFNISTVTAVMTIDSMRAIIIKSDLLVLIPGI